MKKQFILTILLALPLLLSAQQKYENSYLTIEVPKGWIAQNMDQKAMNMEIVLIANSLGDDIFNFGTIIGIVGEQAPEYALRNQISQAPDNPLLKEAKFNDIHNSTFMGKKAKSVDFDTNVSGINFKGAMYSFNENGCTIVSLGAYKVGTKSQLPAVWRTIHWKQFTKTEIVSDLRDEVEGYCTAVNLYLKDHEMVDGGAKIVSMNIDDNDKNCLVTNYSLIEFEKSQFSKEQIEQMREIVRNQMLNGQLQQIASQSEALKRWLDSGYLFKYNVYDKNMEYMYSVTVSPNEKTAKDK